MKNLKIKKLFLYLLFSFFLPFPALAGNLLIKSLGHSSFLIKGEGKSILLNPFKAIGCAENLEEVKDVNVDFILASSRLPDEGYNPFKKLMFVDPGIYKFENIILNGVSVPHDRVNGRRFGMSTVWAWEQNNIKIVHMGGAAGEITVNNQILLSRPDILFISIGGGIKSYDGKEASEVIKKLQPRIVIPVHFLKDKNKLIENCEFTAEDIFLENMKDFQVKYKGNKFIINSKKIDEKIIYIFNK